MSRSKIFEDFSFKSSIEETFAETWVIGLLTYVITLCIAESYWINVPDLLKHIGIVLLTLVITFFLQYFYFIRDALHNSVHLKEKSRAMSSEVSQLRNDNNNANQLLILLKNYYGVENLEEFRRVISHGENEIVKILYQKNNRMQLLLTKLISESQVVASFSDQHTFANIVASTAHNSLWTTCIDKPSMFQERNFDYMDSLRKIQPQLPIVGESDLPPIGRIFIGRLETFYHDLVYSLNLVLDSFQWHLYWGKTYDVNPVKFLLISEVKPLDTYFERHGIASENIIHDFMVVDNGLVYGKETVSPVEGGRLRYFNSNSIPSKYKLIYADLWNDSVDVETLVEQISDKYSLGKLGESISKQFTKRRDKLNVIDDYSQSFSPIEHVGSSFYRKTCEYIAGGTGACFAVDSAAKKAGWPWNSWNVEPYVSMKTASFCAARNAGVEFRRIFLLEGVPAESSKENIISFANDFLDNNIKIGFLSYTDADIDEIEQKYDSDYIIVGFDSSLEPQQNVFGFELEDKYFIENKLTMEDNLIPKSNANDRYAKFEKLWDACIKIEHGVDVEEKVQKLLEGR